MRKDRTKLSENLSKVLLGSPESGMGYHDVLVTYQDGKIVEGKVYNCEELDIPDIFGDIKSIRSI